MSFRAIFVIIRIIFVIIRIIFVIIRIIFVYYKNKSDNTVDSIILKSCRFLSRLPIIDICRHP